MTYILSFNILPGRADDFWEFMEETAAPFWGRMPEVTSVKIFTVIGGTHLYEAHIEMAGLEAFDRIQEEEEWSDISKEFLSLVEDLSRHFLTEEREYPRLRRAA